MPPQPRTLHLNAPSPRQLHLVGATGHMHTRPYQGRDYVVVPVVALMEGVFRTNGAPAPEYVPLSTLATAPDGWNGRPVTLGHPVRNGRHVSANAPGILEAQAVGHVFNARIEGKKLLMDAWIDPESASRVSGASRLLERLHAGETIEVSTCGSVVTDETTGVHNGVAYSGAWREVVPDHLAFLPEGGIGACSVSAGCGAPRAAAADEPPNPYAAVVQSRPTDDDVLRKMREGREAFYEVITTSRVAPSTSRAHLTPPDPYAAALRKRRQEEDL